MTRGSLTLKWSRRVHRSVRSCRRKARLSRSARAPVICIARLSIVKLLDACSKSSTSGITMPQTPLLCAISVTVWAAVVACQGTAPAALSGPLRARVQDERFSIVTSIRGLPLGVRDGLQTLFGSGTLDIAEPGAEFQVSDAV